MNTELKKLNILYVEDDDFIRENFSQLLKAIFQDVIVAKDGRDGIYKYNERVKDIDAIITDINMPYLSGIDMARVINKMKIKLQSKTPIIAVSAYSCDDYGFKEITKHFNSYIKKPIKIKDLMSNLTKTMNGDVGEFCK